MPDDLHVQTRAGNMFLLGRRFDEARARARHILQKDPSNLNGLILLGNALAGLGDLSNAVQIAERAVAADPKRDGTRVNLGTLQLASGNEQEAEEAFTTAVRLNPRSTSAHMALANFYQAIGKLDLAEESLQRAFALAPQDIRTNRALAAFYIGSGKPAQARTLSPRHRRTKQRGQFLERPCRLLRAGGTRQGRGRHSRQAGGRPQTVRERPPARRRHRTQRGTQVRSARDSGGPAEAKPNDAQTQTIRANLLFADRRNDEALDAARAAARLDARSAAARLILGRILIPRGEFEPGRRALAEAVNLDPRVLEARLALGSLHLSAGEVEPAIEVVTAAVDSHPDSIEPRLLLARALLVRPEDRPKALAQAESTVKAFPRSAAARYSLGTYHLTAGGQSVRSTGVRAGTGARSSVFVDALADIGLDGSRQRPHRRGPQPHQAAASPGALTIRVCFC